MSRPKATLGDGYPIQPGDGVTAFALHLAPDNAVFLRPIRRAHLLEAADVAVVQADNVLERVPAAPLMNLRAELSTELPMPGAPLVTTPIPKTLFSISTWAVRYPRSGVTTSKEDSCASCLCQSTRSWPVHKISSSPALGSSALHSNLRARRSSSSSAGI